MKNPPSPASTKRPALDWCPWAAGLALLGLCAAAPAISLDPLPADGAGGAANGHVFDIGTDSLVSEIDAYLGIAGEDLNGGFFGTTAQLSFDPLPAGLTFSVTSELSAGETDLLLRYSFTNNTGATLVGVEFLSFLDVDIAPGINTTFNEYAELLGILQPGQDFEVDAADGIFPEILDHLLLGDLDGMNAFPDPQTTGDVSMALSLLLGDLLDGDTVSVEVLVSEVGSMLGGFGLLQRDAPIPSGTSMTQVTYSAAAAMPGTPLPVPAPLLLMAIGSAAMLSARKGSVRAV